MRGKEAKRHYAEALTPENRGAPRGDREPTNRAPETTAAASAGGLPGASLQWPEPGCPWHVAPARVGLDEFRAGDRCREGRPPAHRLSGRI